MSDAKKEMESLKLHSDTFFLKGIKVGKAKITVRLDEKGYDLNPFTIDISITEPIAILPQKKMRILPTSSFQFSLARVRIQEKDPIYDGVKLPDKQYNWSSLDDNLGTVNQQGMFHSKLQIGEVELEVQDQFIEKNFAEAFVVIVEPR